MRARRLPLLLALLLTASLAANVALVLRWGTANPPPIALLPATPGAVPVAELQAQLQQCKGASMGLLAVTLAGQARATEKTVASIDAGDPRRAAEAADPGPIVTPALEHDALKSVALENLRRQWEQARGPLIEYIKKTTPDPEWRDSTFKRDMNEVAIALNLDDSQRAAFAERDTPLRHARLDAVQAVLQAPEPDFNRLFDEVRGLFADEDGLVTSMYGASAADTYRASQLEERTTVLALMATLANQPWDEHLDW